MILKLVMKHQGMKLYKVCIHYDPGMTLTFFTAMSTEVANAFEREILAKCNQMVGNLLGICKWTEDLCL